MKFTTIIGTVITGLGLGVVLGIGGIIGLEYHERHDKERFSKNAIIETNQQLKTIQEGIDTFVVRAFNFDRIKEGEYRYSWNLKELSEYNIDYPERDAWGNEFNYRTFYDCKILVRKEGNKIIYNDKNYELSSSGPDGIPCTADDIQAWYSPNHEWGSTGRLQNEYNEAVRSPLEKGLREGKGLLEDILRR